jgi:excisionase family DNA binding protein
MEGAIPEYMSATECARVLRVSRPVVLRELAAGRLPGRKVGARWLISRRAVDAWLAGAPAERDLDAAEAAPPAR